MKSCEAEAGVGTRSLDVGALFSENKCWEDKVGTRAKSCEVEVGAGMNL